MRPGSTSPISDHPGRGGSHLTRTTNAAFGVMVSASHNPAADNGIKFFGPDGAKLDDDREAAIEARFLAGPPWVDVHGEALGIQVPMTDALDRYVAHLVARADYRLAGIPVVLDCANGAAFSRLHGCSNNLAPRSRRSTLSRRE